MSSKISNITDRIKHGWLDEALEICVAEGDAEGVTAVKAARATLVEYGSLSQEGHALLINLGVII